jgi:hypothetical protein
MVLRHCRLSLVDWNEIHLTAYTIYVKNLAPCYRQTQLQGAFG